jgi:hypothetical protein
VLNRDLIRALREKRSDLYCITIMHRRIRQPPLTIGVIGFEFLPHPPYSPDLAPFDFSVFPDLKHQLKGQRFENLEELQSATNTLIRQYPAECYRNVFFSQWPKRHERCIACSGSYFEKE